MAIFRGHHTPNCWKPPAALGASYSTILVQLLYVESQKVKPESKKGRSDASPQAPSAARSADVFCCWVHGSCIFCQGGYIRRSRATARHCPWSWRNAGLYWPALPLTIISLQNAPPPSSGRLFSIASAQWSSPMKESSKKLVRAIYVRFFWHLQKLWRILLHSLCAIINRWKYVCIYNRTWAQLTRCGENACMLHVKQK